MMDILNLALNNKKYFLIVILSLFLWPFSSVPTGSQGVVTQFGKIKRIESEGLVIT